MKKLNITLRIKETVVLENPIFVQMLGICPTLAISTSLANGLTMGIAVTFVLVCSNFIISCIHSLIPKKIRIPVFVIILSGIVTAVDMLMQLLLPTLSKSLGLFVPLIVVNCIILSRAESFASKNAPLPSVIDGLTVGIGFTAALALISLVREVLGFGSIFGFELFKGHAPLPIISLSAGGFLTLGMIIAAFQWRLGKKSDKYDTHNCNSCGGCTDKR